MHLRSGIPLISDVDALLGTNRYRSHVNFNQRFLQTHGNALAGYGRHWGEDPFRLWSRRWEYPYVIQRITEFGQDQPSLRILDAGSGVTFLPYLLCEHLPNARTICCDSDLTYVSMFDAINANSHGSRVSFKKALLQSLPFADAEMDVICCLSVLEHTTNYADILREFARVLRPAGLLVLTFDLSLDGRFELSRKQAESLLHNLLERFSADHDVIAELSRMNDHKTILSTDHIKRTSPHLLPWKYPLLKGVHDLLKGKGWTAGFRSKSILCLSARKK